VLRDIAHEILGEELEVLWAGRTGEILGRSRAGNFVYVRMDSGATGWLNVDAIETEADLEAVEVVESGRVEIVLPPEPTATVVAETVLRDTAHDVVGEDIEDLPEGEVISALGITRGGSFIYVETITGAKGWVRLDDVELNVDSAVLPMKRSSEVEIAMPVPSTFTIEEKADLMDRPFMEVHEVVEPLWSDRTGTLLGRTKNGNFIYVETDSGAKGWLPVEAISTDYPMSRLPVEREVEIVQPMPKDFEVVAEETTLMDRPFMAVFEVVEELWAGRTGEMLGRTQNGNFVYVEMESMARGWLPVETVDSEYSIAALPVVREVDIVEPAPKDFTITEETALMDRPFMEVFEVVEELWAGRTGEMLGRTKNGNFVYVEMDSTAKGWLPVEMIESVFPAAALQMVRDVDTAQPAISKGTVMTPEDAQALLRSQAHDVVGDDLEVVPDGEVVTVLGKSRAGSFYYVETVTNAIGWLRSDYVSALTVGETALPVVQSGKVEVVWPVEPTFTIKGDAVLVDMPHERWGETIEELGEGREGLLLGITRAGSFYYVETDSGAKGWLNKEAVETAFPTKRLSVEQSGAVELAEPAPPVFTVTGETVLMDRPFAEVHEAVEELEAGRIGTMEARTENGNFVYVEMDSTAKGWLPTGAIDSRYPVIALPVVREPEIVAPPAKTFTLSEDGALLDRPFMAVHEAVEELQAGRTGTLEARTQNGNFVYVETETQARGWLPVENIGTEYPITALPVVREPEIVAPVGKDFTVSENTALLDRPFMAVHEVVEELWAGRTGMLEARTQNGNFVYVEMDSGAKGWLPTHVIAADYPVMALQVVREPEIVAPVEKDFTVSENTALLDRPFMAVHEVVEEL
ncbi:MAG: hypothetical protein GF311_27575, partial [Candidatus Lokiarchaeota archaeon]|nr:hypothetical protein [Candidatus Lokiarchaeota archaeon]